MGYKQYNLGLKKIRIVGDNKKPGETNFNALALNGKTAYCLKTNADNTKSDLFHYNNYRTSKDSSPIVIKNKLEHGNGLAYHDNNLWVATCHPEIIKLDIKNNYKRYTHTLGDDITANDISGISYYKDNKFIVKFGRVVNNYGTCYDYDIISFDDKKQYHLDAKEPTIRVINTKEANGYTTPQDICYHENKLYVILGKEKIVNIRGKKQKTILENAIIVVDLSANPYAISKSELVNYYMPSEVLIVKQKQSDYEKYELESLDFDGNTMLLAANIQKEGKNKNGKKISIGTDALLEVTKKTEIK